MKLRLGDMVNEEVAQIIIFYLFNRREERYVFLMWPILSDPFVTTPQYVREKCTFNTILYFMTALAKI